MGRDCYIPADERAWMVKITNLGRDQGFEYDDGVSAYGSLVKALSHLSKAMKCACSLGNKDHLERHIFKTVWWLYRALYLLRGKQHDDNHDQ